MEKRISVGKRLADDMTEKKGIDALFESIPAQQYTSTSPKAVRFEKGTFYFDPADLAQLEKVWLDLMTHGVKCSKSEIVSILLRSGLTDHETNPTNSLLAQRLSGKRRRI